MAARGYLEQLPRLYHLLMERGPMTAINYALFRSLFAVHSLPIARLINRLAPYPVMIEIEPTTYCNLKCNMCENTYWNIPKRNMSFADFKTILDQFPWLCEIGFTGIGESLMNPDYLEMCRYIKQRKAYLEIFDNMTMMYPVTFSKLYEMGLDRLSPSIDGATKETYEAIRKGAEWDTVTRNLQHVFNTKQIAGTWLPEVTPHYIVQKSNLDEMPAFIRFMRRMAYDQPIWIQFTEMFAPFEQTKHLSVKIPESMIADCNSEARKNNVTLIWNRNTDRVKPAMERCSLWLMPFIFVNGDVSPCCGSNESNDRSGQYRRKLGNVFSQPFKTIWRDSKYQKLRDDLYCGLCPEQCERCPTFRKC